MPRTENQLDPDAGPLAAFACDLRALRESSGYPSYRVLAKRAGFSASTLSVAASGVALPSLDVTLAYVQACGGDPGQWRERWESLAMQQPCRAEAATCDEPDAQPVPRTDAQMPREPARAIGHGRRGTRSLAVGVAMAALGGSTVIALSRVVPSASLTDDAEAKQQADAVYAVMRQSGSMEQGVNDSVGGLFGCVNLPGAVDTLEKAARERRAQADQVAKLDVSKLPNGTRLITALNDAWTDSEQADHAYADAGAALVERCVPEAVQRSPDYWRAEATDRAAAAAWSDAIGLWQTEVDSFGEPQITGLRF